jgi:hypothetical protein
MRKRNQLVVGTRFKVQVHTYVKKPNLDTNARKPMWNCGTKNKVKKSFLEYIKCIKD